MSETPASGETEPSRPPTSGGYVERWRSLSRPARLYLLHAALLTGSLAIYGLFFNLLILSLGYERSFLGTLNGVSLRVAAVLSVPLWWLVTRTGLRHALLASGALNAISAIMLAVWPQAAPMLLAVALTGAAAVLFQVSSPPLMMRYSDGESRDHLFSANAAINIGVAGIGSWIGGGLPTFFGGLLGVGAESALAYRATFAAAGGLLCLSLLPLLFIPNGHARERPAAPSSPAPSPAAPRPGLGERLRVWWRGVRGFRIFPLRDLPDRLPSPWDAMARRPGMLIALLIPPFFISWGAALLIPYLNLFFKERFVVADTTLGTIFAILGITTGLAALAGPVLSTRIGKASTIIVAQALSIPFLLLLGWTPLLAVAVGAALMRGALFNMGSPLYDAFAMERTDEAARPIVIGLINGAYTVGYLAAPEISTSIQARYGFSPLFVITAVFYTLAVLSMYLLFGRQRLRNQPR